MKPHHRTREHHYTAEQFVFLSWALMIWPPEGGNADSDLLRQPRAGLTLQEIVERTVEIHDDHVYADMCADAR